ncbi:UPF0104 family protein [Leptolyngbya sp. FACHB-541]|uniref:lysylphosphatidylglycerol synthase transmembrane domain-containing protein n=1 Tax=Leptolyngbya sp. FACHB-541 TaxID=2692810 RepID=UPI00168538C9|nr:YbhN family protein [Leptolyngbya sp. FACHB-541]MBD1996374.1 UPF0104 family protein [Leptolyngbya sp. FACHB-541]
MQKLKPYLRWFILGGTLFFIAKTLRDHWQEVASIRVGAEAWGYLAIALTITLLAHVWTGWVWGWILAGLNHPVSGFWSSRVYLQTNVAKYLPGNVWHFYGRAWAAKAAGIPLEIASLSVLLEPLLMAAAALIVALVSSSAAYKGLQLLGLGVVLVAVHPRSLNPATRLVGRLKKPKTGVDADSTENPAPVIPPIQHYPFLPLLGELIFLGLRGAGFCFTVMALTAITWKQVPLLLGAFSVAWLLGLIIPGAPGGIGVFEATAIALLDNHFPPAMVVSAVAVYRLVSLLAELAGAGIAWLYSRRI